MPQMFVSVILYCYNMKYLCYEKMAEKQSFCDVFFFAWCTSVGFQTLYLFVSCFKNAYTTWLDCKVMERRHDVFHNILFFPDRRLVCRDFFSQFGCRVKKCRNAHYKTSYYMHHKFVIVDNVTLITGSFNWTRQAVVGNRENVLVTNNDEIVQPYIQEFKKLWEMYNPRN